MNLSRKSEREGVLLAPLESRRIKELRWKTARFARRVRNTDASKSDDRQKSGDAAYESVARNRPRPPRRGLSCSEQR